MPNQQEDGVMRPTSARSLQVNLTRGENSRQWRKGLQQTHLAGIVGVSRNRCNTPLGKITVKKITGMGTHHLRGKVHKNS